ncbi:MAG: hypothetical protein A2V88_04380 [Elusimicrobia bacterium RBG_16_66_12]|nr:MAG: hypothetical protein A2V88_04380 [Elusimicrobia bacterium RBG_16_66_12]
MSVIKWIGIILGTLAIGAGGLFVARKMLASPMSGTETVANGRIVAWQIVAASGPPAIWIVKVGIGADLMRQVGEPHTTEALARAALEAELARLRLSQVPRVGASSSPRKPGEAV